MRETRFWFILVGLALCITLGIGLGNAVCADTLTTITNANITYSNVVSGSFIHNSIINGAAIYDSTIVNSTINTCTTGGPLLSEDECYKAYYYRFFAGFTFDNLDDTFENGMAVFGVDIYTKHKENLRSFLTAKLTSLSNSTYSGVTDAASSSGQKSLEMDGNVFWSFHSRNIMGINHKYGVILNGGFMLTEVMEKAYWHGGAGLRALINPDAYLDLMYVDYDYTKYGRFVLRMQGPVKRINENNIVILGMEGNFSTDTEDTIKDNVNIYLKWQTELDTLLKF